LAHRAFGKDLIDQQRCTLSHAPGTAAGAQAPSLAAKSDQVLSMTAVALNS